MLVVLSRQPEEGQGLFDGILGPACQARIACRPFGKPCGKISPGLCEIAPVVEPAQFLQAVVAVLPRQMIERVPEEVHVAALPGGFGDHLADRCHQAGVIVGDRDQHRLAHDNTGFTHLLVARIEDEVRKRLLKGAPGKGSEALVQPLVDGRDRRGREGMAAQFFRDRLHLAGRHALDIHLRQCRHQGPLGTPGSARTARWRSARPGPAEPAARACRPASQGYGRNSPSDSQAVGRALALRGTQRLVHLGLKHLLHHRWRS